MAGTEASRVLALGLPFTGTPSPVVAWVSWALSFFSTQRHVILPGSRGMAVEEKDPSEDEDRSVIGGILKDSINMDSPFHHSIRAYRQKTEVRPSMQSDKGRTRSSRLARAGSSTCLLEDRSRL